MLELLILLDRIVRFVSILIIVFLRRCNVVILELDLMLVVVESILLLLLEFKEVSILCFEKCWAAFPSLISFIMSVYTLIIMKYFFCKKYSLFVFLECIVIVTQILKLELKSELLSILSLF